MEINKNKSDKCYEELPPIDNWKELIKFYYSGEIDWSKWIFRGQGNYKDWELSTSLERAINAYDILPEQTEKKEQGLLRKFKRQYKQFSAHIPHYEDNIEWLSIMQHYGCPTRLLDFSYSFFVALFFAIENIEIGKCAALWAINYEWLREKYKNNTTEAIRNLLETDKNAKNKKTTNEILHYKIDYIIALNPFYMNERLVVQQGLFVLPLNVNKPYMENLKGMVSEDEKHNVKKIKIVCDSEFIKEAYLNLNKMNINNATLFPGIDGFAKFLKMLLPLPEGYLAVDKEKF